MDELIRDIEHTAVRLVRLAGAVIHSSQDAPGDVQFKGGTHSPGNRSPASDVDRGVEQMLRDEITRAWPDHGIIGEEMDDVPCAPDSFIWVLDPLDGTSNFLNGLPLFASTIGVLHQGKPVAAATWCMTTHVGAPGVFHAHRGSALCFEQATVERRRSAAWRGLAGEPVRAPKLGRGWDTRIIGSSATECAYVAAGMLRVAAMDYPRIWDVAGGVLLAKAAGCSVYIKQTKGWKPFTRFDEDATRPLRAWRGALLFGEADELQEVVDPR